MQTLDIADDNTSVDAGSPRDSVDVSGVFARPHPPPTRAPKFPMEDLELDPMSIHDGRILRRVLAELPPLPAKPAPSRILSVDKANWDDFLMIWNMLSIFSFVFHLPLHDLFDF